MPKGVLDQLHAHQCNLIAAAITPRFRQTKLNTPIIDVGVFRGMYLRDAIAQIVNASDWRMLRTIEEQLFACGFDRLTREQKVLALKNELIEHYCSDAGKPINMQSRIVEFNDPASKEEVDLIYAFRMARFDHRSLDRKEMQSHYGVPISFELTDKQIAGPDAELLLILRSARNTTSRVRRSSSSAGLKVLGTTYDLVSVDNSVYEKQAAPSAPLLSPSLPPRPAQFSRSPSNQGLSKSASKASLDTSARFKTALPTIVTDGLSQLDGSASPPPPPPPGDPRTSGYGDYEEPSDAIFGSKGPVAISAFRRRP